MAVGKGGGGGEGWWGGVGSGGGGFGGLVCAFLRQWLFFVGQR